MYIIMQKRARCFLLSFVQNRNKRIEVVTLLHDAVDILCSVITQLDFCLSLRFTFLL